MKKLLIGILLVSLLLSMAACAGSGKPANTPTLNTTDPQGDGPGPEDPSTAQVRILNTDPQLQQTWIDLAGEYSRISGVDVTIVTSDGDLPTLRRVNSREELPENCADLSQTNACAQLISQELTLRDDEGHVLAVADNMEVYGLMYNSTLLAQTANTRDDICSFTDLTEVVYSITDAKNQLGFSAFARVDPDDQFALQIASLTGDSRNLVELILNNTTGDPFTVEDGAENEPLQDFLDGKAVFFLACSQEQGILDAIGSENIGVLPVYIGGENEDKQTLCVAPKSYWCVEASASEADVLATVDFLEFLTNPRENGTVPVDDLERVSPYRHASYVSNMPEMILRAELAMGKEPVVCRYVPQVPQGLTDALIAYAENPSDDNWSAIRQILEHL